MLTRLDLRGVADLTGRLPRPRLQVEPPIEEVRAVIAAVRERGDDALRELTLRFDGVEIDEIVVPREVVDAAVQEIDPALRTALEVARDNIESYHRTQLHDPTEHLDAGLRVRELRRPVDRAGCYVPSALAPLMSTVLMTVVPAKVAGVPEVVLATAPGAGGRVDPAILAAASLAGADEVVRVGGPAAIAALALGTDSIAAVDVIVGPGSARVAQAKREVAGSGLVGVPSSFAGPSEVVVVADEHAVVADAAIDVVLQAEHGPDGLAWLVTWDEGVADRVSNEVGRLVEASPRREYLEATLAEGGYAAVCDGPDQAMEVVNAIAPEHLELQVADPEALLRSVRHAGAVFCGPYSPASLGDYVAGPNHVLPTAGTARFAGALRVDDFCKHIHVVEADREALARLGPHVAVIAEAEGLPAHAQSVRQREDRP